MATRVICENMAFVLSPDTITDETTLVQAVSKTEFSRHHHTHTHTHTHTIYTSASNVVVAADNSRALARRRAVACSILRARNHNARGGARRIRTTGANQRCNYRLRTVGDTESVATHVQRRCNNNIPPEAVFELPVITVAPSSRNQQKTMPSAQQTPKRRRQQQ
jgi:hypothetical protein